MQNKTKIKIVDITGFTPLQIENTYNNTYGLQRWRIIQFIVIGTKTYLIAEKEI